VNSWADVATVAVTPAVTVAAFLIAYLVARGGIVFGSALSREQRARKAALREAKRLVYGSGDHKHSGDPGTVLRMAEFILGSNEPPETPQDSRR
jgi:hypothetical protein